MIGANLKGGLGNLMFQIAAVEYLGKIHNISTGYPNIESQLKLINGYPYSKVTYANEYYEIFENFKWPVNTNFSKTIRVPFHYVPIKVEDNTLYDGFFQSEKYFPDRQLILNLFKPSEKVIRELKKYSHLFENQTTCSIHIRRSDYIRLPNHHPLQTLEYFKSAQELIGEVDQYLIFSDDLEWCRENFIGEKYTFIETDRDYYDLFLQTQCTHNIISNSSFSWWGAWLNINPTKIVVAPTRWFGPRKNLSDVDIIPTSWKKI